MSDTQQGPDWWQASDGKWYPPEQQPATTAPPAPTGPPAAAPAGDMTGPGGQRIVGIGARIGSWALNAVLTLVTLGIGWLIWATVLAAQGTGQTPGKKLLGHVVIHEPTGQRAGFARMFWGRGIAAGIILQIGFALLVIPGIIILLMPLFNDKNKGIWEQITETVVVYE